MMIEIKGPHRSSVAAGAITEGRASNSSLARTVAHAPRRGNLASAHFFRTATL